MRILAGLLACALNFGMLSAVAQQPSVPFSPGSRVFIEDMNGFEVSLRDAFLAAKVPLKLEDHKDAAQFLITGSATLKQEHHIMGQTPHSLVLLSVSQKDPGTAVYGFVLHLSNATAGLQSAADAAARRLKHRLQTGKD